jgi:hypothetical protein
LATFSAVSVMYWFLQKKCKAAFWAIFHKPIWSSCSGPTFFTGTATCGHLQVWPLQLLHPQVLILVICFSRSFTKLNLGQI